MYKDWYISKKPRDNQGNLNLFLNVRTIADWFIST